MNAISHLKSDKSKVVAGVNATDVRLGKDVLELVSTAMYVDPLVVYREYIQNAADAIDMAREAGLLGSDERGTVTIDIDVSQRSVRIRDNGIGVPTATFVSKMTAIGASEKRALMLRGFRGVGRLSGLGHCQELVFRSRTQNELAVAEVRWDCRKIRSMLNDHSFEGSLADLVSHVVSASTSLADESVPARFFEVELVKIPRGKSDKLLSPDDVGDFLSQVGPVPFDSAFSYGGVISERLRAHTGFTEVDIHINDRDAIRRPHRDVIELAPGRVTKFEQPQFVEIPTLDGDGIAAVAWFLHHDYEGALTVGSLVKGVRLRAGNLQVGDAAVLESIFPESRFNSWAVGEVHVLDRRLAPNGRRDQFEVNAHYGNLLNHLTPVARDIAHRCRTYSSRRSKLREFELAVAEVQSRVDVINQGALDEAARSEAAAAISVSVGRLEKLASLPLLSDSAQQLGDQIKLAMATVAATDRRLTEADPLEHVSAEDQVFYRRMIKLIYAHSVSRPAAKSLVDRILESEVLK